MYNDIDIILNGLQTIYESDLIAHLRRALINFPDIDFNDVFTQGQIKSKLWLIDELISLDLDLGVVYIVGGWYGSLAAMMFESNKLKINKIRSFDIDTQCANIADTINRKWVMDEWTFKASTMDMHDIDYNGMDYSTIRADGSDCNLYDIPDCVINTSCEHIDNYDKWFEKIPDGALLILQSNNFYDGKGHINCVDSLYSFKQQSPMDDILYEGHLNLEKYDRFMLIGRK